VVEALEELAEGRRHLIGGDARAGLDRLESAHVRVQTAQALLPPEVLLLPAHGREPIRLERPRDPLLIPLSAIDAETLKRLRPSRGDGASGLRVDLDELERRLTRALAVSGERSLGELFLAMGTALSFEQTPRSSLANDGSPRDRRTSPAENGSEDDD
jgi:hypothetical protein